MTHTITLIAGDGIGPEVTEAVVTILERAGLQVNWEPHVAGVLALETHGDTLPTALLDSVRRNKVALKGPVTTPVGGGFTSEWATARGAGPCCPTGSIPKCSLRIHWPDMPFVKNSVSQISCFLFPALVLVSLLFTEQLTFVIDPVYVGALALTAIVVWQITGDGEAVLFEGMALVAFYVVLATLVWFE